MIFRPQPVQSPRIPIWTAAWWPNKRPLRRAAQWDGVCPGKTGARLTPEEWKEMLAYVAQYCTHDGPFDAVHSGSLPGDDLDHAAALVQPYIDVGVNWWIEPVDPWRFGWRWEDPWTPEATQRIRGRVRQGPPPT